MRKLETSDIDPTYIFNKCIKGNKSKSFLISQVNHVNQSALKFNELAKKQEYFKLKNEPELNKNEQELMVKVYSNGLVRTKDGKQIYNTILNSVSNGICPICGIGIATTLDHYLPKSIYYFLIVAPNNLVPMCNDCNKNKSDRYPINYTDQLLHPYFDDFSETPILYADVTKINIESYIPRISYYIKCGNNIDNKIKKRIEYHFKTYKLNRLYSSNGANELSGNSYQFNILRNIGEETLKKHLKNSYDSYYYENINSWKTALYRALYESNWFSK
jgi:5-methylcytosine-specific restriction endonuclease McrA